MSVKQFYGTSNPKQVHDKGHNPPQASKLLTSTDDSKDANSQKQDNDDIHEKLDLIIFKSRKIREAIEKMNSRTD
jgi:hypothetical protein